MTYREVLRKEKNRGQRKQLLYEDGLFSSRGRLGFYISKRGIVLGVGAPSFCMLSTPLRDKWSACYSLLQSTVLHTAKYYCSSAPVLQSTTPVRLCKHSTSPYYKVLLGTRKTYSVLRRSKKYCSILQSTTPVHTAKHYSSTALY